jgi:hypothetical protein
MMTWARRLRGAVGTGLTWAAGWAVAGIGIGASTLLPWHPFGGFLKVMDAPLPAMAIPGFFAGLFFAGVVGVAGRRIRFRDLSTAQFIAWGAVGGALLVLFPFLLVAIGLASTEGSAHSAGFVIAAIAPVFVALSSASAAATLFIARRAEDRATEEPGLERTAQLAGEPSAHEWQQTERESHAERVSRERA